jgi:integrase
MKTLIRVAHGEDMTSKKVVVAIDEFAKYLAVAEKDRARVGEKIQFINRTKSFFATKRLKEITTTVLADLNDWLRDNSRNKTLAPSSSKRYAADVRQFLNWCVDRGYLDALPKLPKLRTVTNRRPNFDNKDWAKVTARLKEFVVADYPWIVRDRTMLANYVLILANTGIRVGEARNLRWCDLREIPSPEGTNKPADIALFVNGKTGPREVVARKPEVKNYFKKILELREGELKRKPDNEDYVFCNRDGTPIGSFKKSFAALLRDAGAEKDAHGNKRTIYSLRHTYATFRLQEGVHQFVLAKNMGTSVVMLEKHYGHTSNVASAAELTKSGTF